MAGLTLAETEYSADLEVAAHAHDHAICCFVLEGSFTERSGNRSRLLESGALLFHPQDEPHSHRFHGSGSRCFNVQFGAGWMGRMQDQGVVLPADPAALRQGRASWLADQLHREFCACDSASNLAIEGLALTLLGELSRTSLPSERGATPRWLLRAVELLHARMNEAMSMADIAQEVQVHPTRLSRTFRQYYGCTMGEYVRRLRINFAKQELLTTARTLSAIAFAAGFSDQAHFSRTFKQVTGMTPRAYRLAGSAR